MNNKDYRFYRTLNAMCVSKIACQLFCILTVLSVFSYMLTNNPIYALETIVFFIYTGVCVLGIYKHNKNIEQFGGKF